MRHVTSPILSVRAARPLLVMSATHAHSATRAMVASTRPPSVARRVVASPSGGASSLSSRQTRHASVSRRPIRPPRAASGDDDDPPPPPPLSEAAQRSLADVRAAVANAAADPVALASPSAPNQYLPGSAGFSLPLPPEPVRFPRAPLNIKLAVMLLRSTYETVDAMDIMPMDQFQIKFWKARQAEWEPYKFQYAPLVIEQGKLADPLYFDFISYVQCQVIAREIPNSAQVFEERSGAEGTTRVVRRDAALSDNKILPAVLAQRVGDLVYARLRFGFEEETFPGVPEPVDPAAPDALERVVRGMDAIVNAMVAKGYALKGGATTAEGDDARVRVFVAGPANLWGAQALAARGVSPPNEYLGYALTGFCRASGVRSAYTARTTDTGTELEFTLAVER